MQDSTAAAPATLWTIGHSTRSLGEFTGLLGEAAVSLLVDIRSLPRSRTNPQFNADVLQASLAAAGIGYRHLPALGGLRRRAGQTASANMLWRNASFRNYADYAATSAIFRTGLDELIGLACGRRTAIMCAEAVWWRCHRRIVADYLLTACLVVWHIMGPGEVERARLTAGAMPQPDGRILYPAPGPAQLSLL